MYRCSQLRTGSGACLIFRSADRLAPGAALQMIEANLRRWLAEPWSRRIVAGVAGFPGGEVALPARAAEAQEIYRRIQSRLEQAIRRGDLLVVRVSADARGNGDDAPPARAQVPGPGMQTSEPRRTWIEIELVDDRGAAVSNERCRIELPDGSLWEGMTDDQGVARVDGIEPGTCEIDFPDLDMHEWEAV